MNNPDILTDLEASIHRLGQRLARIERFLGRANSLASEPRTEKKERKDDDLTGTAGERAEWIGFAGGC